MKHALATITLAATLAAGCGGQRPLEPGTPETELTLSTLTLVSGLACDVLAREKPGTARDLLGALDGVVKPLLEGSVGSGEARAALEALVPRYSAHLTHAVALLGSYLRQQSWQPDTQPYTDAVLAVVNGCRVFLLPLVAEG